MRAEFRLGPRTEITGNPEIAIRAESIQAARRLARRLSDQEIRDYLNWQRQNRFKRSSYYYWVQSEVQPVDRDDLRPKTMVDHYRQLANLISDNLELLPRAKTADSPGHRIGLVAAKRWQLGQQVADFERLVVNGGIYPGEVHMEARFDFSGLPALDPDYNYTVCSDSHWLSYTNPHFLRCSPAWKIDYRIYLNPRIQSIPAAAGQLIALSSTRGLPLYLKILNQPQRLARNLDNPHQLRRDGLVLFGNDKYIDDLLGAVLDCYRSHQDWFESRCPPVLTTKIAPGIGVATNSNLDNPYRQESFGSHRAGLIDTAFTEFKPTASWQPTGPDPSGPEVALFRQFLDQQLIAAGVDPDNLSFDLPVSKRPGVV